MLISVVIVATLLAAIVLFLPGAAARRSEQLLLASDKAKLIAAIAGLVTLFSVFYTMYQVQIDLVDRAEERTERNINALLRRAAGSNGKGQAINALAARGVTLTGMNLSCSELGDWVEQDGGFCRRPPIFTGIDLRGSEFIDVDFTAVELLQSRFETVSAQKVDFTSSRLVKVSFISSTIEADFGLARLQEVVFTGTTVLGSLAGAEFDRVDVSASIIENLPGYLASGNRSAYAWADAPPRTEILQGDEIHSIPLGENSLARLVLCKPPSDGFGRVIVLAIREPSYSECVRMSPNAAMRRFPEGYTPRVVGYWG